MGYLEKNINLLKQGGFSDSNIERWKEKNINIMLRGGFSEEEVMESLGTYSSDKLMQDEATMKPIENYWSQKLPGLTRDLQKIKRYAVGEESQIYDFFREGFGQSTTNLMLQYHTNGEQGYDWKKAYGNELKDDGAIERLVRTIGTLTGDAPVGIAAGLPLFLARKPIAAAATAGFVNDSVKTAYLESLKGGKVKNFSQWWKLFVDKGVKEGIKGGAMFAGTIAGPAGLAAAGLGKGFMTTLGGTYLGMTGMGSVIESVENKKLTLPSKQQLADNALLIGSLGFAGKASQMAYNRMTKTKESLADVSKDLLKDPVTGQEAASLNINAHYKTLTPEVKESIKELQSELKTLKNIENGKGPKKVSLEKQKNKLNEELESAKSEEQIVAIDKKIKIINNQLEEHTLREQVVPENEFKISQRQEEIQTELKNVGERIGPDEAKISAKKDTYEDSDMQEMSGFINMEKIETQKTKGEFNKADRFMYEYVDSIFPVKKIEKLAQKMGAEKNFVYEQITNLGGVVGKAMSFINGAGTKNFLSREIDGKSLVEILKPLKLEKGKSKYDEFSIYKVSKRNLELTDRGIKTGIPRDLSERIVNKHKDEYETISKEYDEFTQKVLQYMEDSGVISKQLKESIIAQNKDFVPFFKMFDPKFKGDKKLGGMPLKQIVGVEKLEKKINDQKQKIEKTQEEFTDAIQKGDTQKEQTLEGTIDKLENQLNKLQEEYKAKVTIVDPIEVTMKNTMQMIMLAERNIAAVDFIKTIESARKKNPDAFPFINKVKPSIESIKSNRKELEKVLETKNLTDEQINNFEIFRAKSKDVTDTQVAIIRDGKREVWDLGTDILAKAVTRERAFNKLYGIFDVEGSVFKMAEKVTQLKRFGITVHPKFTLANFLAQELTMPFIAKTRYIPVVDGIKGIVWQVKNKEIEKAYMSEGKGQSTFVDADRQLFSANKMREQIEGRTYYHTLDPKEPSHAFLYPMEVMKNLGVKLARVAQRPTVLTEQAPRLVASKNLENKLIKDNEKLPRSQRLTKRQIEILSTYEARDIIDFARKGASMEAAGRINAFLNAGIQGLYKTARVATDPTSITRFATTGVVGMTIPTILLWYANKDSKTYENTTEWEKLNFWVLVTNEEKGEYFTIRKPWEIGWLFATLPEKMLNYAFLKDKDYVNKMQKQWFEGALGYFSNFIPISDVFMPYIEEGFNRNMYTKRPVMPRKQDNKLAEFQYTPETSETAKIIGDAIRGIGNFFGIEGRDYGSPIIIDHYISSYTATLGRDVIKGLDAIIKKYDKDATNYIKPWSDDTVTNLTKVPIVNYFFRRTPKLSAEPLSKYWQNFKKIKKYQGQVEDLIEQGKQKEAIDLFGDYEVGLVKLLSKHTIKMQEKYNMFTLLRTREVGKSDFTPQQIDNMSDTLIYALINHAKLINESVFKYEKNFKNLKK